MRRKVARIVHVVRRATRRAFATGAGSWPCCSCSGCSWCKWLRRGRGVQLTCCSHAAHRLWTVVWHCRQRSAPWRSCSPAVAYWWGGPLCSLVSLMAVAAVVAWQQFSGELPMGRVQHALINSFAPPHVSLVMLPSPLPLHSLCTPQRDSLWGCRGVLRSPPGGAPIRGASRHRRRRHHCRHHTAPVAPSPSPLPSPPLPPSGGCSRAGALGTASGSLAITTPFTTVATVATSCGHRHRWLRSRP